MAKMTRRTTFSLDPETIERIKRLASHWNVSQAEAVRRAVARAEEEIVSDTNDIAHRLDSYHASGGIARETAEHYLGRVAEDREKWRE
jgi:hypothetical protein